MTSSFSTSRDRDAWAAIRGFVYQVDLTVIRWLELRGGELLELERGEDIDHITDATDHERLLEQIKAITEPVSLRSSRALEALANAVDHLATNPSLRLMFRFTTTALVAREQEHPIRGGLPGITLWESIRREVNADDAESFSTIQILLQGAPRPKKIRHDLWERARHTFSDRSLLNSLIMRFEWATGEHPPEILTSAILDVLQRSGRASSINRSQQLYEQLFVRVFRLLASPGLKQLSPSDLEEEISRDGVREADAALLRTLRLAFEGLHERVAEVEQHVRILNEQSRQALGEFLPDPLNSSNLSLRELADEVESTTGGRVEILAQAADRLFLWLRRGKLEQRDTKLLILAVACLLSGVAGAQVLEVGLSDTASLVGTLGDEPLGKWRVRLDLAQVREIARSKVIPLDFWTHTQVVLTAGDNLRVGERRVSMDDWEIGT